MRRRKKDEAKCRNVADVIKRIPKVARRLAAITLALSLCVVSLRIASEMYFSASAEIEQIVYSPDMKHMAVMVSHSSGAWDGTTYGLFIVKAGEKISGRIIGNVYQARGGDGFGMRWLDNNTLSVGNRSARAIYRQKIKAGSVSIQYTIMKGEEKASAGYWIVDPGTGERQYYEK